MNNWNIPDLDETLSEENVIIPDKAKFINFFMIKQIHNSDIL